MNVILTRIITTLKVQGSVLNIHFHPILNAHNIFFKLAWKLYEEAFPANEKRFLNEQIQLFEKSNYFFQALLFENQFIGFLGFWEIDDFIFIEHFAIQPQERGKNYGTLVLNSFLQNKTKVILEIEPPLEKESIKRLHFYEKLGFVQNELHHFQVPFRKNDEKVKLHLLSYKTILTPTKYTQLYDTMQQQLPL